MSDDLTVAGVDGIRRSFDEHYDTVKEVVADPYGAWDAIQEAADRIEELEAKLAKAVEALDRIQDGSYGKLAAKARAVLAELRGENQ
jgi:23S rRNA G2069 N7-methylase RlmK/C1962 C5-methylase RlmI